ncbi:BA14K family protein [Rhizobium paknamense]|uniref:Lectin-like protein BA14k n=1 Tax=Rhizobium paknamense TaxID=1206817 RepID=A0ABU0IGQ3_9HYPH|nr:BA14K family protein [Rhizobium paknamense]MDQ0456426.1 hypothetical protein [Rhizobium paknamense]
MPTFSRAFAGFVLSGLMTASVIAPAQAITFEHLPLPKAADVERVQYRDNPPGLWKGYRGATAPRSGYRRHSDGFWYPLSAFGARPLPRTPDAERSTRNPSRQERCAERYRSYRAFDNTYQPLIGPRQKCGSP